MPSTRLSAALTALALATVPGIAAAQQPPIEFTLTVRFAVAFVVNFAIGAVVVGVAPEWADGVVAEARDDFAVAVLTGTLGYLAVIVALVLVALTIIGIVVTLVGLLGLIVLSLVGTPLGAYTVGHLLTERTGVDGRWPALLSGTLLVAVVSAVPIVGQLGNMLLASPGIGVLLLRVKASLLG